MANDKNCDEDKDFSLDNTPFRQSKTKREMIEEGECQIAEGRCYTTDELMKKLDKFKVAL